MKPCHCLILAAALLAFQGCSRKYVITTHNGARITTSSKPQFKEGVYIFKDASGRPSYVPASRVREVAPASMAEDDKSKFISPTAK